MSYMPAYAEIHYMDRTVLLAGSKRQDRPDGLGITTDGVEGWRSTPEAKVTLTERASGDGAHDIAPSEILYSARTVTIHWVALAEQHDAVIASLNLLLSAAGQLVRLRVVDGADDTYATGYVTVSSDAAWHEGRMVGTMIIVCPGPSGSPGGPRTCRCTRCPPHPEGSTTGTRLLAWPIRCPTGLMPALRKAWPCCAIGGPPRRIR